MLLQALLDILFPPLCHSCKEFMPDAPELKICPACLGQIEMVRKPLCPVCGVPFAAEIGGNHRCGSCIIHPPPYLASRSAAQYAGPLRELIHRFKYGYKVQLAVPLGLLAADALAPFRVEVAPEVVVPVPLHRKRLRQRGYNQSQLIAEVVAKKWKVPVMVGNLRRVRWTEPQTKLDAADRCVNVKGAFGVRDPQRLKGKRVLLFDDVLTTGSTVRECALALRQADVAAVLVATLARGAPR